MRFLTAESWPTSQRPRCDVMRISLAYDCSQAGYPTNGQKNLILSRRFKFVLKRVGSLIKTMCMRLYTSFVKFVSIVFLKQVLCIKFVQLHACVTRRDVIAWVACSADVRCAPAPGRQLRALRPEAGGRTVRSLRQVGSRAKRRLRHDHPTKSEIANLWKQQHVAT